jgi:hypothetical protein
MIFFSSLADPVCHFLRFFQVACASFQKPAKKSKSLDSFFLSKRLPKNQQV